MSTTVIKRPLHVIYCDQCRKPEYAVMSEKCRHCGRVFCGEGCVLEHLCGGRQSCDDGVAERVNVDIEAEHEARLSARAGPAVSCRGEAHGKRETQSGEW
jgi:hypothetical protein